MDSQRTVEKQLDKSGRVRKLLKWGTRFLIVTLSLFVIGFAALVYDVHAAGSKPSTAKADAAIVLGAAIDGEEPSPVFRARIQHGIDLLKEGRVKRIIFTGGKPDGSTIAESAVAKKYALQAGVAKELIYAEDKSHTTYQNLFYARDLGWKRKLLSFIVVSDPYHLRRAMRIAKMLDMDATPSAVAGSSLDTTYFLLRETTRNIKLLWRHGCLPDAAARELAVDRH